ncbi:unnamed protein product [Hermetia illucens]|uniref:Alkaline phosphatase n=1 Tax=Hermetia illucens TaxID=343691 RepID=A0A7R8YT92_HERIL|nr:alkaline phosphatase 4 [Hermetia illucens]CAD7084482.1 unnamed protein product [Hermetia illucens]
MLKTNIMTLKVLILFIISSLLPNHSLCKSFINRVKRTEDMHFWREQGENHLKKILATSLGPKTDVLAKNIIVFIGDGMGMTTITAGRIYKGQTNGGSGEEASLVFDDFPYTGLAKTYNVDKQVPDSAGTATAIFCGVKTRYGVLGMDNTTHPKNSERGRLTSLLDWAQSVGKRTGIVTTTRITHATPASLYSNIHDRDWECDGEIPEESTGIYKDIGRQLVEDLPGRRLNVILGGGKSPLGAIEEEPPNELFKGPSENVCSRRDGRNLTDEWLDLSPNRVLALNKNDLLSMDAKETDHLMGIFSNNHITFKVGRQVDREPSLPVMVDKALDVLIRPESRGFVLVVEGGRIDQAHHQNYAKAALEELLEMDEAISLAMKRTESDETLIVVTADHSHAMTLNGYPKRGNDILGFGNKDNVVPYETITYANGPGFHYHRLDGSANKSTGNFGTWVSVQNIDAKERDAPNYRHLAAFPLKDETHGGEDVPVYAYGPGAHLIRGVFEQNYIAYVLSYAGCFGPTMHLNKLCIKQIKEASFNARSGSESIRSSETLMAVIISYIVSYLLF